MIGRLLCWLGWHKWKNPIWMNLLGLEAAPDLIIFVMLSIIVCIAVSVLWIKLT